MGLFVLQTDDTVPALIYAAKANLDLYERHGLDQQNLHMLENFALYQLQAAITLIKEAIDASTGSL